MPTVLNAGAGHADSPAPAYFTGWHQIRIDVNPATTPDVLASITDLSAVADASVDAVWAAHCVEHLFAHEVPQALREFRRVLAPQGFACIIVPDIQAIAEWVGTDRMHQTIYQSPAGPVTAHDMLYGFGPAIARGETAMAHHCGFTPTLFLERLNAAGFAEIVLRRRSNLELAGLALKDLSGNSGRRDALMAGLGL
jgi:SAM-dependent methyltransferase